MKSKASLLALCVSSFSTLAHANINQTFNPYVSATYGYNSNLFLLQNEQAALSTLGTTSMSESFHAFAAGVNINWQTGRQVFSGRAEISKVNFDTYKTMDYNGHNLAMKLDWVIGDMLLGDTGVSDTLTLAPFLYTKKPLANLLTTRRAYFNGYLKLDNRWQLKLGADKTRYTNSDASQQYYDSNIDTYKTGFRYLTPKGSKIDFNSAVSNGDFPNQPTPIYTYTQYDNGISLDWSTTGRIRIQGKANYTRRNYPNAQQLNYGGFTGRVSADWVITGKTTLNLAAYRDIGTYITGNSTYDITQGVSAKATWLATSNIAVNLNAKHDSIDYQTTPQRLDRLSTLNLDVAYTIMDNTKLDIVAERGIRHSNIDGDSYRYNSLTLGLNHAF